MTDKIHQTLGDQGACPPPLGSAATPGCNLTFFEVVNGVIPCNHISDCPQGYDWWEDQCGDLDNPDHTTTFGFCEDNQCKFVSSNCGWVAPCFTPEDNLIIGVGYVNGQYQCNVDEDCYVDSYSDKFNKDLDMKCRNKQCISKNKALWSSLPFTSVGNDDTCPHGRREELGFTR